MAIAPPTIRARGRRGGNGPGVSIGGGRLKTKRPFEDLREKEDEKRDDDEDARRRHEPRR